MMSTLQKAEICLHFSKFVLVQSICTLCKSIYMAEKGKIWGKNSYANRLLSYANRFALMAEANLVQKQLCKSIYTLCKSICTVKMLKNALFEGYFDLVPTKHKHTKAQGNIFGILVSKTIYTSKTLVLDDFFADELSTTSQVEF